LGYAHQRHYKGAPQTSPSVSIKNCIAQSLTKSDSLTVSGCVDQIMNLTGGDGKKVVGNTTQSSYRRLHELIASALDYCVSQQRVDKVVLRLERAKVMIEYQSARGQVSPGIKEVLEAITDSTKNALRGKGGGSVKEVCRYARLLLDAVAVLVYRHGRK